MKKSRSDLFFEFFTIGLAVIIMVLIIIGIIMNVHTKKQAKAIKDEIVAAVDKTWFDYSYEMIENYDENGKVRYHVTYYYSTTDGKEGELELIFVEKDGKWKKEEIKRVIA